MFNIFIMVSGGDVFNIVGIVIYDKSVFGGMNNLFILVVIVFVFVYIFIESFVNFGNYILDWLIVNIDGKFYEVCVMVDDGINFVV